MDKNKTDNKKTTKSGSMTSFVEGETISGKFLRVKETEIKDRITGLPKTIRVYKIRLTDGSTASISSRTLLDDAFDDECSLRGGWENMIGKEVTFTRGQDVVTVDDDTEEEKRMGTYTVTFR